MFRISPDLKKEVERKAEESNCTMTSYLEFLIEKDLAEEEPKRVLLGTSSEGVRKRFVLKKKLS